MDAAWQRWFAVADRFDAVLWLTPSQLHDVETRVGRGIRSFVVPHPAPAPAAMASRHPCRAGSSCSTRSFRASASTTRCARSRPCADRTPRRTSTSTATERSSPNSSGSPHELGVADAVVFQGHVSDPARAWAEADVFLFASTNEAQGLVVLEALSAGVPVVSYDMPYGPRDTLAHGGGLLVADGDVEALADALASGDRATAAFAIGSRRRVERRQDDGCRCLDACAGSGRAGRPRRAHRALTPTVRRSAGRGRSPRR